jgi:hypothetical protein
MKRVLQGARELSPYLLIELLLPGGTVIALLLWMFRRRTSAATVHESVSNVTAAAGIEILPMPESAKVQA